MRGGVDAPSSPVEVAVGGRVGSATTVDSSEGKDTVEFTTSVIGGIGTLSSPVVVAVGGSVGATTTAASLFPFFLYN